MYTNVYLNRLGRVSNQFEVVVVEYLVLGAILEQVVKVDPP